MKSVLAAAALAAGLLTAGAPAGAHHSFAIFDSTKVATLDGTVKDFQWTNPHSVVWVYGALTTGGAPTLWSLEMTAPSSLTRMGWNKRSLKPGDQVVVEINPLRDGGAGGSLRKATLKATGEVLTTHSILTVPLRPEPKPAG
jgi:hypothetical protein